jgi:hypothetical protein
MINPIFRLSEVKKALVQARMAELLDVGLVEISKGEYALKIMMSTKKDIFGNWTKCHMCGDYCLVYKWTRSNKYAMRLLEEIFDAIG